MAKGGKREAAGRKVGSKNKIARVKKSQLPVPDKKQIQRYQKAGKPLHMVIRKYISSENNQLYKTLFRKFDDPLIALKALLDDMMVRYNYGRIAEMEGVEAARRLALETAAELKKEGKLLAVESLLETIVNVPTLSRNLTSLSAEIRQISALIHTIESGSSSGKRNIFLIFNNPEIAKKAENRLFRLPKEVIDAQIIEEELDENPKN